VTKIRLITLIEAPVGVCFDLARSVDVHLDSLTHTKECVVAGRKSGLCQEGDMITWEAKHFGIRQHLTVGITHVDYPNSFEDEMIKGAFRRMHHRHEFVFTDAVTTMKDYFTYEVPFGLVGSLFDSLILKRYMTNLLIIRNSHIKQLAETR
jgi:ligand-binding SRPBCC domain-containing protein